MTDTLSPPNDRSGSASATPSVTPVVTPKFTPEPEPEPNPEPMSEPTNTNTNTPEPTNTNTNTSTSTSTPAPAPTATPASAPASTPSPTPTPTVTTSAMELVHKSASGSSSSSSLVSPTSSSVCDFPSTSKAKPSNTTTSNSGSWWQVASPDARYAITVLFLINLLNYIDRYVPSAAKSLFQTDLNLSDVQTSLPLTAFIIVYMLTAPLFSYLADIGYPRKWIIAIGVASWSVATSTTGLANNYAIFIISRAAVGVGEAAYATISPALLSDYWPSHHRNAMLSFFYLAMPVGAAIGFGIGGLVGDAANWRVAFIVCGTPGVAMALLVLKIVEPRRGCQESIPEIILAMEQKTVTLKEALLELPRNPYYCYVVGGSIFVVFGTGGMADWFPEWMHRTHNVSVGTAGLVVGAVTVVGGIGGIGAGAFLGNYLRPRVNNAYLLASSLGMVGAFVFALIALMLPSGTNLAVLTFVILICQICLWIYVGPTNSLIANCVSARLRVRAYGVSLLITHTLGDAISPTIIGAISGATGDLTNALILVPLVFLCGGVIWGIGAYRLSPLAFELQTKTKKSVESPTPSSDPNTTIEPPAITIHSEHRASLLRPGSSDSSKPDNVELQPIHLTATLMGNTPIIVLEQDKNNDIEKKEKEGVNTQVISSVSGATSVDGPDPMIGILRTTGSQIDVINYSPELRNRHHSKEEKTPNHL